MADVKSSEHKMADVKSSEIVLFHWFV
jgi:hypothetical protein